MRIFSSHKYTAVSGEWLCHNVKPVILANHFLINLRTCSTISRGVSQSTTNDSAGRFYHPNFRTSGSMLGNIGESLDFSREARPNEDTARSVMMFIKYQRIQIWLLYCAKQGTDCTRWKCSDENFSPVANFVVQASRSLAFKCLLSQNCLANCSFMRSR